MNWREHATKVVIHIADDPCHGSWYHDLGYEDDFPWGDYKYKKRSLKQELVNLKVNCKVHSYNFYHITDHTKKMIKVLND